MKPILFNTDDEILIQRYYNNERVTDILPIKQLNKLYRVLKKYNLPKRIPCNASRNPTQIIKLAKEKRKNNIEKYGVVEIIKKNGIDKYKVKCSKCGNFHFTGFNYLKKQNMCLDCVNKNKSEISSKSKKRKSNTSGFIGISLINGKNIGVRARIVCDKITVLNNFYKDDFLHDKTILQAAIDRDIFIIERNLPHTRNFTDLELFANMEYLAYEQIEHIKTILRFRSL